MIIGIDFDNTIIDYSDVFGRVALQGGIIKNSELMNKSEVKNFLISIGNEEGWTELQGKVYGSHIMDAKLYDHVLEVMGHMASKGHKLKIISHKTKYPFIGERVDLRVSAMQWMISNKIVDRQRTNITMQDVYFCDTIAEKVNEIKKQRCDIFIDDLITVLDKIDNTVRKILFNPNSTQKTESNNILQVSHWQQIGHYIDAI